MSDKPQKGEIILFQAGDGHTKIQVRFEEKSVWLSQKNLAELYQVSVKTVSEHIVNIFDEGELTHERTVRNFQIVQSEGKREVTRAIDHYSLEAILAVGYRVRSSRGTQFRQWATAQLQELLAKGFVMDDERLKEGTSFGQDYFDELLLRIRDIRSSERRFYQKITDIYSTSIDYDGRAEITQAFYATVQNKLHWAIFGQKGASVPSADKLAEQTQSFIDLKKKDPKVVPEWKVEAKKPYLFLWEKEVIHFLADLNRRPPTIDERIRHIKTAASSLLRGNKYRGSGTRVIFSVEHPDRPHNLTSILTMLRELNEQSIDVQIAKGAFRYEEGRYKGKVIQEISMVCHYQSQDQKDLILAWIEPYQQQSYLHIHADCTVDYVVLKPSVTTPIGTWQEIPKAEPRWLQLGQGYSIVGGAYYGTQEITEKKRAA
jgi:hypothetical protein